MYVFTERGLVAVAHYVPDMDESLLTRLIQILLEVNKRFASLLRST